MCFLRNFPKNPQEKLKNLEMAGLATRKVGAEPGLVPRLAGGGSAPDLHRGTQRFTAVVVGALSIVNAIHHCKTSIKKKFFLFII